jgi:hypothetical protein
MMYFRSPFPSTQGFSAYRMPGMAVHGPLFLAFTLVGFLLCWPQPMMRPLIPLWALAGLYLGRDLAIFCHYSPLLTLICWASSGFVLLDPAPIASFGAQHAVAARLISVMIPAFQIGIAGYAARDLSQRKGHAN